MSSRVRFEGDSSNRTDRKWTGYRRWAILVALAVLLGAAFIRGVPSAARWLDVGQPPVAVEYAYLLPGHPETRPFVLAMLVRHGFAHRALLPTVALSQDQRDGIELSHHEKAVRVCKSSGISDDKIETLDIASVGTADESRALARFLKSRPRISVAVVTSAYHTRRARWMFRQHLGDLSSRVYFVSAPTPEFRGDQWWRSHEGFRVVTSEYLKLFFYWLRYGWGLYWMGAGGVALALLCWSKLVSFS